MRKSQFSKIVEKPWKEEIVRLKVYKLDLSSTISFRSFFVCVVCVRYISFCFLFAQFCGVAMCFFFLFFSTFFLRTFVPISMLVQGLLSLYITYFGSV